MNDLAELQARQLASEIILGAVLTVLIEGRIVPHVIEKIFERASDAAVINAQANGGKPETARALQIIDEFQKMWVRERKHPDVK